MPVATRALRRLTNDAFADLHPSWSPDGSRIAFAIDRFTSDPRELDFRGYRLAVIDVQSGKSEQIPAFDSGKHINSQWSVDASGGLELNTALAGLTPAITELVKRPT